MNAILCLRPLPDDFIMYARQDSHFLLYVYDLMHNELIEKGNELNNLLQATYSRSTELCLKVNKYFFHIYLFSRFLYTVLVKTEMKLVITLNFLFRNFYYVFELKTN